MKRPDAGWPWEQPGFRFHTPGWPPMHVPTAADEQMGKRGSNQHTREKTEAPKKWIWRPPGTKT